MGEWMDGWVDGVMDGELSEVVLGGCTGPCYAQEFWLYSSVMQEL